MIYAKSVTWTPLFGTQDFPFFFLTHGGDDWIVPPFDVLNGLDKTVGVCRHLGGNFDLFHVCVISTYF